MSELQRRDDDVMTGWVGSGWLEKSVKDINHTYIQRRMQKNVDGCHNMSQQRDECLITLQNN